MITPETEIITAKMSWDSLPFSVCLAAYISVLWEHGPPFGPPHTVPKDNIAFKPALELSLIDKTGAMHESMFRGLAVSVFERSRFI